MPTPEEIAAAQQASADAANAGANDDNDDNDDDDLETADAEKLREQLKASRRAERQTKRQYTATTRELETIKQGQMSEAEKLQKERDEAFAERDNLKKSIQERDAREVFSNEARKAGALRPEALFKLADQLEYDDDGKLLNTKSAISDLKKEYPELFGVAGSSDGGSGRGTGAGGTESFSNTLRRQLGRSV